MDAHHREWYRLANGPLPTPLPPIRKGKCPGYREPLSCCNWPYSIVLLPSDWLSRRALYHETTHWVDKTYLTDPHREQIRLRYGWPAGDWWDERLPNPNCERLAWLGVEMYLHPRKCKWLRAYLRGVVHAGT